MRAARCTLDNETYTIENFGQTNDFANKRRNLICIECDGPAFYRGPTRNGREACFGARHGDGCNYATLERVATTEGEGRVEYGIRTTGQRIVVNFNYGATTDDPEAQPTGGLADAVNNRGGTGGVTTVRQHMNRSLSSLLRSLMANEEFRGSRNLICVPGHEDFVIADLFINFIDVTGDHVGRYHGFWGIIPDVEIVRNTLWLNTLCPDNMSILIDERHAEAFYQTYQTETVNVVYGAHMLVFGYLKRAQRNNKIYVEVTDPCHMSLRLIQQDDDFLVELVEEW